MATDIHRIGAMALAPAGEGFRALRALREALAPDLAAARPDAAAASSSSHELEAALEELVARAAESGAELDFRIDDESGRVIVSVLDRSDGTVLRQMPSEEALRIARSLARYEPHLIEVRA